MLAFDNRIRQIAHYYEDQSLDLVLFHSQMKTDFVEMNCRTNGRIF